VSIVYGMTVLLIVQKKSHIEVAFSIRKVVPPNLKSHSKPTSLIYFHIRKYRHRILNSLCRDGESVEVECVEDHVRKAHNNCDDDCKRYDPSREGFVLIFLFVTQQLRRVEEICCSDQRFEIFDNFKHLIIRTVRSL